MKVFLSPHSLASEGSQLLAEKLNAKRINPDDNESKYKYKDDHILINWGATVKKKWFVNGIKMLNSPVNVAVAVDKIATFKKLKDAGVSVPEFTTDINQAKEWVKQGNMVFCRTKTKASGGDGIVIANPNMEKEIVAAPLYTLYKKKKAEYRVAVVDGVVIDYMQKKKRQDWNVEIKGEVNPYIRSHDLGWIFARQGVNPPKSVLDIAVKTVKALGLDFASVDIIYNESEDKPYVLEANTAPGLEEGGTSLERYSKAFLALLNGKPITPAAPIEEDIKDKEVKENKPINPPVEQLKVAAPAPIPAAKVQEVKKVEAKNNNLENYNFEGFVDIKMKVEGDIIKITGKAHGVPQRIKIMEINNGKINYFLAAED